MKLKIEKIDLLNLLSKTQNIVEKRNTMPVLSNILIEAKDNKLKVYATDLEVSLTDEVTAEVKQEGKAAVGAKNFYDIVRELPEGPISLIKKDNNWIELKQKKSIYNIVGIAQEEYPVFPASSSKEFVKIQKEVLKDMIEKTIYSVSQDETRYHLNGVYFEQKNTNDGSYYRMVATDGHRLSLVDRKTSIDSSGKASTGVIVPRKGLNEIKKLLDEGSGNVEMAVEGAQLVLKNNTTVLLVRLIEGKYPNYEQLIPQSLKKHISVSRENLLSSLKRVSLLSNQKSKSVTLTLNQGNMEITSNNPELGEAKEEIEIRYTGDQMKIGFNAKYLLDILSTIDDEEIDIELNDQLSPGLIRPHNDSNYTCVVMPMRI